MRLRRKSDEDSAGWKIAPPDARQPGATDRPAPRSQIPSSSRCVSALGWEGKSWCRLNSEHSFARYSARIRAEVQPRETDLASKIEMLTLKTFVPDDALFRGSIESVGHFLALSPISTNLRMASGRVSGSFCFAIQSSIISRSGSCQRMPI